MKRTALFTAILLLLTTLAALPAHAESQNIMAELYNVIRGEWEIRDDVIVSKESNGTIGDAFLTSDIYIESATRATVSVDITITGGTNGAAGFCIAELDPTLPLEGGCILTPLDISAGQAKLFCVNAQTMVGSYKNVGIALNQSFNMRLEIYDDDSLEVYIDDELCCQGLNTNFPGGYIGIYTFSGSAEFRNLTVEYDGAGSAVGVDKPTSAAPGTYRFDGSASEAVMGKWTTENGVLTALPENVDKEAILMSDLYFAAGKHLTVTADVRITDGAAVALLLSETSRLNPLGGGALIYNIDAVSEEGVSRFFSFSATYTVSDNYPSSFETDRTYKLRLEIFENGDMEAYLDDVIIHNVANTGFTGGYLGVYTWLAAGTFENVTAVYGGTAPKRNPEGLETQPPEVVSSEEESTSEPTATGPVSTAGEAGSTAAASGAVSGQSPGSEKPNVGPILAIVAAILLIAAVVTVIVLKKKKK